jgi:hypothetical protein
LAYSFANVRVYGEKYRKYVRSVVAETLRQSSAELPQLRGILTAVGRDCANVIGITQEELIAAVDSYGRSLDGRISDGMRAEDLKRLGERKIGRQYLTASLLMRLLERTGG